MKKLLTKNFQKKNRKKPCFFALFFISILFLTGCQKVLETPVGAADMEKMSSPALPDNAQYEMTKQDCRTANTRATEIDLNHPQNSTDGSYLYDGQTLMITAAGDYTVSGKMEQGNLRVRVFEDELVHLFLKNAEIYSNDGAAIYVENAAKVVITALQGSANTLSANFKQKDTQQACIFSLSDLTINGEGTTSVYCYQADGVRSKDLLKVVDTNLYVKAKRDGIRGNDGVIIYDSTTAVDCEGTGIFSASDKDRIILQGGQCKVVAGEYAISARQYVSIHDNSLELHSVLGKIICDGILELDKDLSL